MAKLRLLLYLAIWLMVGLIATVTANSPLDCFRGSKGVGTREEIETIHPYQRSLGQWKKLAKDYIKMLRNTKKANEMSISEVALSLKNLREALNEVRKRDIYFIDKVPKDLIYILNLANFLDNCHSDSIYWMSHLVEMKKVHRWQFNYALDVIRDNLERCGYEKDYKEAIETMKDADLTLAKYPTLDSYLRGEYWTQPGARSHDLSWTLWVFRDVPGLQRDNATIYCTTKDLVDSLVKLDKTKSRYLQLHKLLKYRYQLYLRKRGYEDRFKKAIDSMKHGQWNLAKYPTLAVYLTDEFYPQSAKLPTVVPWLEALATERKDELNWILTIFKEFTDFNGNSNDESSCEDRVFRNDLIRSLAQSKRYYPQLHELVKEYFELYSHKCGYEEKFKSVMNAHSEPIHGGESPFASYLWAEHLKAIERNGKRAYGRDILFALQVVSDLYDSNVMKSWACSGSYIATLAAERAWANEVKYTKLIKCLDESFADYLKVCTKDLKWEANNNYEALAFIKELAKQMRTHVDNDYKNTDPASREIIEYIFPHISGDRV